MSDAIQTILAIIDQSGPAPTAAEIRARVEAAMGERVSARPKKQTSGRRQAVTLLDPSSSSSADLPHPPVTPDDSPHPPAAAAAARPSAASSDDFANASSQSGGSPKANVPRGGGARRAKRGKASDASGDRDALDLRLAFFPQTDLGNAERFVARFRDRLRWCPAIGWLWWDGKRWSRDGADEHVKRAEHETVRAIQDEAEALAASENDALLKVKNAGKADEQQWFMSDALSFWGRASEQNNRLTPISKHAGPYLYVDTVQLDADPFKINVNNGTLVVRKREGADDYITFKPHDPEDLITKLIPVDYDAAATSPVYDNFLAFVQPKAEVRRFLHQWGGLSLTGDISEQKLVFFWGKGKNGKTTLLSIWCYVAGDYSRTVPIETFVNEGRSRNAGQATPDLAMLQGRRLVQASEPDRGAKLSEALIKLITGGDVTPVRFLNREYFDLVPQFKLTMSGNYRPKIEGADEGIWRRVILVPWTVTVPEDRRDKHLGEKLKLEASGVLNRLLDGLRDWLDRALTAPEDVVKATADYRRDSDPLGRFLDACVVADAGGRVQASVLHEVFTAWSTADGAASKPWSPKGLASALKERGFESHHSNVNWWLNVKLTKSVNDFVDHEGKPLRAGASGKPGDDVGGGRDDGEIVI